MTRKGKETLIEIKAWSAPLLIVMLGWFIKNKFDNIDMKLNSMGATQIEVAVNRTDINTILSDVRDLKAWKEIVQNSPAKHEEIYQLPKP